MKGFAGGVLLLVALEVLTRTGSASRVSGAAVTVSTALNRFLSPDVAGIPVRRKPATSSSTQQSSTRTPAAPTTSVGTIVNA